MYYYGIDYDDSSLAHYGVKGMRWGIRKKPPRKLRNKNSVEFEGITPNRFKSLTADDYLKVKKGTTLYRISGTGKERNRGMSYVTANKKEAEAYGRMLKEYGTVGVVNSRNKKKQNGVYLYTFKTKRDLYLPSYKTTFDSEAKRLAREYEQYGYNVRDMNKFINERRQMIANNISIMQNRSAMIKNQGIVFAGTNERGDLTYNTPSKTDYQITNDYIRGLKKNGYNAAIDNYGFVDNPIAKGQSAAIVVNNRRKALKKVSVEKL